MQSRLVFVLVEVAIEIAGEYPLGNRTEKAEKSVWVAEGVRLRARGLDLFITVTVRQ